MTCHQSDFVVGGASCELILHQSQSSSVFKLVYFLSAIRQKKSQIWMIGRCYMLDPNLTLTNFCCTFQHLLSFYILCGYTFICISSSDEWNLEWQMKKKKKTTAQYKQLAPNNFLELLSENWRPIKYRKQSNTWILNVQLYYFFFYHADCKLISSDTHFLLTLNWIKSQFSCPAHSGRHLRLSTAKIDRRISSLKVYRRCNTGEPKCILHQTPIF